MFYFKPPRGLIHREKILDLVSKRLKILRACQRFRDYPALLEAHLEESEAVAEGTARDRIAHYALLVAASRTTHALNLFLAWETRLFALRARSLDRASLASTLRDLERHLGERLLQQGSPRKADRTAVEVLASVSELLEGRLLEDEDGEQEAETEPLLVPFYLVPTLVRSRRVELVSGRAKLGRVHVVDFLQDVFKLLLEHSADVAARMEQAGADDAELSEAVVEILKRAKDEEEGGACKDRKALRAAEVPRESALRFPACMRRLQSALSRDHRLGHADRVAYTLFLKDCGMGPEEAVRFWSAHYSAEAGASSSCQCKHVWDRRMEYSVMHLYGRRGARTDYRSHSCATLRANAATSSAGSQLFCPFADGGDIEDLAGDDDCEARANARCATAFDVDKTGQFAIAARPADFFLIARSGDDR